MLTTADIKHLKPSEVEYKLEQREDRDVEVDDGVVPAHQVDRASRPRFHLDVVPGSSNITCWGQVLTA